MKNAIENRENETHYDFMRENLHAVVNLHAWHQARLTQMRKEVEGRLKMQMEQVKKTKAFLKDIQALEKAAAKQGDQLIKDHWTWRNDGNY